MNQFIVTITFLLNNMSEERKKFRILKIQQLKKKQRMTSEEKDEILMDKVKVARSCITTPDYNGCLNCNRITWHTPKLSLMFQGRLLCSNCACSNKVDMNKRFILTEKIIIKFNYD